MSTSDEKQASLDPAEIRIDLASIYSQIDGQCSQSVRDKASGKYNDWKKTIWSYGKTVASIAAHAGFFACLATVIWSRRMALIENDPSTTKRLYHYYLIASSLAGFLYIVMMVEAAACDTYRSLLSFTSKQSVLEYMYSVQNARPKVRWHARSYHFEMRTQTRLQRDAKGQVNVRQLRQKEKLITHKKTETLRYNRWTDVTCDMKGHDDVSVVKIECSKIFIFKDDDSREKYNEKYQIFRERNKDKDEFTEYEEEFHIPGYKESFMACVSAHRAPCWLSEVWFWLFTMTLLTWPYRWLFRAQIPRHHVVFIKELEL